MEPNTLKYSGKVIVITIGQQGPRGPQGSAGASVLSFRSNVDLIGTKNGVNQIFTLPSIPYLNSEVIYYNGVRLKRNVDYTISGSTVTIITVTPQSNDYLDANYFEEES